MLRVAIAACWVWVALAGSASARAAAPSLACSCADQPAGAAASLLFTEVVGLDALDGQDAVNAVNAPNAHDAKAPANEEEPLAWCISADDPRCAPRDAGSTSSQSDLRSPLRAAGSTDLPAPLVIELPGLRPFQIGAPRSGEHYRVERPPRPY